jgi:hypothetical protein
MSRSAAGRKVRSSTKKGRLKTQRGRPRPTPPVEARRWKSRSLPLCNLRLAFPVVKINTQMLMLLHLEGWLSPPRWENSYELYEQPQTHWHDCAYRESLSRVGCMGSPISAFDHSANSQKQSHAALQWRCGNLEVDPLRVKMGATVFLWLLIFWMKWRPGWLGISTPPICNKQTMTLMIRYMGPHLTHPIQEFIAAWAVTAR